MTAAKRNPRRKPARSTVRWSDQAFREFAEVLPDAHVFVDQQGRIVLANQQAEFLFNYPRARLVGERILLLIPQRFHARVPIPGTPAWGDSASRSDRRGLTVFGRRADGSEFPADITVQAVETDVGTVFAAAIRDITDQVQTREHLIEHLSDLAHVTRLSTMGEMVAGLAHELNQPLYAIANYARACQKLACAEPLPLTAVLEMTDKLVTQAERAAEIVRRLRQFVTRREARRARVDLNALVCEVQQLMLFHSHRFAITLRLELEEGLPPVHGDAILLEQVLVNLVRNSFEALGEARTPNPSVVVATARSAAGLVEVTVCDNGPGFETTNLAQLFEPYYTTKEQGMGLGLAIGRSIAEAHGGRLVIVPSGTGGATFRLSLPPQEAEHVA